MERYMYTRKSAGELVKGDRLFKDGVLHEVTYINWHAGSCFIDLIDVRGIMTLDILNANDLVSVIDV